MSERWSRRRDDLRRRRDAETRVERDVHLAAEDAGTLKDEAVRLVDAAHEASWYEHPGNAADAAMAALCRLRRAGAGEARTSSGGDEAVRHALHRADRDAVVWLASRAVSYMDEHGFPEAVEPWLDQA